MVEMEMVLGDLAVWVWVVRGGGGLTGGGGRNGQ